MKKIVSALLTVIMLFVVLPLPNAVFAADNERYTVLVLDTSGSVGFEINGVEIYNADTALDYVKQAAVKFSNDVINSGGKNYIAVVSYNDTANLVSDFTDNITTLTNNINNLRSYSSSKNMTDGLNMASNLIDSVSGGASKNVVLFSTGMVDTGEYSYTGIFSENTDGSDWQTAAGIPIYAYANSANAAAQNLKNKATIYSLGLFQTMEGVPEDGKSIARLFRTIAENLATSSDTFYDVDDPNKLQPIFGEVATVITTEEQPGPATIRTSFGATVSAWAAPEIELAFENNLIPEVMLTFDMTKKVNRGEFAAIVLQLYDVLKNTETGLPASCPFVDIDGDINETAIKKAYGLNFAAGTSDTKYEPLSFITREQLATMLCRVIKKYSDPAWNLANDSQYYLDTSGVKLYADDGDISDWAKPSVYFMTKFGIIYGIDDTHFAPKNTTNQQEVSGYATATREQAIILAQRIFKVSDIWS